MDALSIKRIFQAISRSRPFWSAPIEWQRRCVASLSVYSTDDIGRSYAQYRCQWRTINGGRRLFLTLLSCIAMPLMVFVIAVVSIFGTGTPVLRDRRRAFFLGNRHDVIPESLGLRYSIEHKKRSVVWSGLLPWLRLLARRAAASPYFTAKCLVQLATYNGYLSGSNASAIICCSEYSFCSSILTAFCEARGATHINVMHGEKLYNMRDSFFRFSECFLWDARYESLFLDLGASPGQFIVDPPKKFSDLSIDFPLASSAPPRLTYYLQKESMPQLHMILHILQRLAIAYEIKVRLHPIYSVLEQVRSLFPAEWIEDPRRSPFQESLCLSTIMVSKYSTVLFEGFWAGRIIVIDDLTDPDLYEYLCKARYIMIEKAQHRLSSLIETTSVRIEKPL